MLRPLLATLALVLGLVAPAFAHTQSYGFLTATLDGGHVEGRLELAIRDLDAAAGLDGDGDGRVTWGEVRLREAELASTMLAMVSIGDERSACPLEAGPLVVDQRGGETYLVAPFAGACAPQGAVLVSYNALFPVDAQHRGIVSITAQGVSHSAVMTPETRAVRMDAGGGGEASLALSFVGHGVHHIWIGYDHILFLITLMLGVVVLREDGRWVPVDSSRKALVSAAKIVTAFTAAHSVTLALAALDVIRLPVPLVESTIAATIALAALNTVWPVVHGRIWLLAFGFGLIHGFGFANVLADLTLPTSGLLTALLAFNIGVELGQLAIVAVVLPILLIAGRSDIYPRVALPALSLVIAGVGLCWLVGRTFGIEILPVG